MKLSELKTLIDAIEGDAALRGTTNPDVSFWLTTAVKKNVREPGRHSIFTDVVPDSSDPIYVHRITVQGKSFGDYSIPLNLYVKEA